MAAIFMMGAYIGLLLVTEAGFGIFPALIGAMIGGAVLGYGLEIFALRPLRRRKVTHLAPLISTIGVSTFLESVALMVWGPQTRSFPATFDNSLMDMGLFKISGIQIISLGTAVVLMVLLTLLLDRTKVGKAVRATSENAETAGLLGINTGRIITFTVMLASALGAAAGVLIGLSFNAIEPTMGTAMGLKGLGSPHHGRSRQRRRRNGRRFHSGHCRSIHRRIRRILLQGRCRIRHDHPDSVPSS